MENVWKTILVIGFVMVMVPPAAVEVWTGSAVAAGSIRGFGVFFLVFACLVFYYNEKKASPSPSAPVKEPK